MADPQHDVTRFAVGVQAAGRYEILRFIAVGGMGQVYAARDLKLDTTIALKTLKPELQGSSLALERFRREIALARGVTDPHVCRTYDVGEHEGCVFLTMELVEGQSLAGPLPVADIDRIATQLVRGLAALHAAGIVHRDFKTSNILMSGDRAVITDFGLARSLDANDDKLTIESGLLGTPAYMAPEQVEGRPATPASDIYALGVVLFELLTGRLPFVEDTAMAAATARLHRNAPRPSSVRKGIPARWDAIVLGCLARDPKDRPRLEDVLGTPAPSRRWVLAAGGLLAASTALGLWQSGSRRLREDQAIAVLPVGKLFESPRNTAIAIDVHDLLTSAGVPAIDLHSLWMDMALLGPAIRWSRMPDPIAAAFAFPHIAMVVQHAIVDDEIVLAITTRDGKKRELRAPIDAHRIASTIAELAGFDAPRVQDPPLSPAQHEQYGAALALLWRKPRDKAEAESIAKLPLRRRQWLADFSDAVPTHARAAARLADFIQADAEQVESRDEFTALRERSRSYFERALAADPRCAHAIGVRGHDAMLAWKWSAADADTKRANELAPTNGRVRFHRGFYLQLHGRFEEWIALSEYDRVIRPHERLGDAHLGYVYWYARRYEDAVRALEPRLKAFDLKHWQEGVLAGALVSAYTDLARYDEAYATSKYLLENNIDAYTAALLIPIHAVSGRLDEAKQLYAQMRREGKLAAGQLVLVADAVGDLDTALDAAEKLVNAGNAHALFFKIDRVSGALRSHPRYQALMKKMNF